LKGLFYIRFLHWEKKEERRKEKKHWNGKKVKKKKKKKWEKGKGKRKKETDET
jgi:hypothetical protein